MNPGDEQKPAAPGDAPAAPAPKEDFIPSPASVAPIVAAKPEPQQKRPPGRPAGSGSKKPEKVEPKDRAGRAFDPALHLHIDGVPVRDSKGALRMAPKAELTAEKEARKAAADAAPAKPQGGLDPASMKPAELAELAGVLSCVVIETCTGNQVADSGRIAITKAAARYFAASPVEMSPGMGLAVAVGTVAIPAVLSASPASPAGRILARFGLFGPPPEGAPEAPPAEAPTAPPQPPPARSVSGDSFGG